MKENKTKKPYVTFSFSKMKREKNYVCFYIRDVVDINSNKNDYKKNLI